MLQFASAAYLGIEHGSGELRPWPRMTLGMPAALAEPRGSQEVAQELARLQGCQRSLLATSTLHLFWDVFGLFPVRRCRIHFDAGIYPIGRWGVERAAARGIPALRFPHHDAAALARQLQQEAHHGLVPIVVADGFCPACGHMAPLPDYLDAARRFGGIVVLDDTQPLGVLGQRFGHQPGGGRRFCNAYGQGGGGSLRWHGIDSDRATSVLTICSLAKGFGAPLAALSGSEALVRQFEVHSLTRVHCSPPSVASLRAAEHALTMNRQCGNELRFRLAETVSRFQRGLSQLGLSATGGIFPMQTLAPIAGLDARDLQRVLENHRVQAVLHETSANSGARVSFLFTARHRPHDVDIAIEALGDARQLRVSNRRARHTTKLSHCKERCHARGNSI